MKIDYYKIYSAKVGDEVENPFDEKWTKLDGGEAYEYAKSAVPENDNRLRLHSFIEVAGDGVNYNTYYIACYSGGRNGHGEWPSYLEDIKKTIENMQDSWLVDMSCDCLDDVFDVCVGFWLKTENVDKD